MIFTLLSSCGQRAEQSNAPGPAANIEKRPPTQAAPATEEPVAAPDSALTESAKVEPAKSVKPAKGLARPKKITGQILYNPPAEMVLNVTRTIEIRIAKNQISQENVSGTGAVQTEQIPISQTMSVRLCCGDSQKGDPFDISTASAEEQLVLDPLLDDDDFSQWIFQVTPRKSGQQQLQLIASAHYQYPDGRKISKDEVLNKNINVQVDTAKETQNWFAQNWHWLGLLLVTPLVALLINRRRKNKSVRQAPSGNEAVFISYRRDDSSGYSLAIYEKLKTAMGDENVFMDMDDIPHGEHFAEHIDKVLSKASTVLVMIGQRWLNASNAQGRRLDSPSDFVRMEIARALSNGSRVIPVLLKGAEMPQQQELPEDLQALCMRNAIRIYDDQFDASIERLIQSISD